MVSIFSKVWNCMISLFCQPGYADLRFRLCRLCSDFVDLFSDFADLCSDFEDLCLDFADVDLRGDYDFLVPTRIE